MINLPDGDYSMEAVAVLVGDDLVVTICGGSGHHVGAVAIGIPRPSLSDPKNVSASVSVFCVTGHKDDLPARRAAELLASSLNCVVSVSVGIHVDDAGAEDIARLKGNFEKLLKSLPAELRAFRDNRA